MQPYQSPAANIAQRLFFDAITKTAPNNNSAAEGIKAKKQ